MADTSEILTDVAKTIGGTLGAVVGNAEAMKDKVVAAVEKAPSFRKVKRTAQKRVASTERRVRRTAGRLARGSRARTRKRVTARAKSRGGAKRRTSLNAKQRK